MSDYYSIQIQTQYSLSLSHSVVVNNNTCEYTGVINFNAPKADLPFPQCNPPPHPEETVLSFGQEFVETTGFDHLGFEWVPCGHPNLEKFGKSHFDFHLYRVTPDQRASMACDLVPGAPICAFPGGPPPDTQTTSSGRKFFIVSTVVGTPDHPDNGKIANMPQGYAVDFTTALPGSGVHAYDMAAAVDVAAWTDPLLVIGSYNGGIAFWEPMFPYSFVSGTVS